jgi:hypothetical protein
VTTPDDILSDHTPAVQATANALRALIIDTVPEMTERAYPGWHGIGYRHPRAGYVCGVFPQATTVRLLFEHGHELSDPEGILTGGGSQTRTVDVVTVADIPIDAVRALLLQAVAR